MAGGALREGQYIRRLARWLSNSPAEEGLPYPVLVGGSRDDVSFFALCRSFTLLIVFHVYDSLPFGSFLFPSSCCFVSIRLLF